MVIYILLLFIIVIISGYVFIRPHLLLLSIIVLILERERRQTVWVRPHTGFYLLLQLQSYVLPRILFSLSFLVASFCFRLVRFITPLFDFNPNLFVVSFFQVHKSPWTHRVNLSSGSTLVPLTPASLSVSVERRPGLTMTAVGLGRPAGICTLPLLVGKLKSVSFRYR